MFAVFVLVGLGTGWVLITANSTATLNAGRDSATAGALVMTSQQIGASLGTALLSTVAGTAAAAYHRTHPAAGAGDRGGGGNGRGRELITGPDIRPRTPGARCPVFGYLGPGVRRYPIASALVRPVP